MTNTFFEKFSDNDLSEILYYLEVGTQKDKIHFVSQAWYDWNKWEYFVDVPTTKIITFIEELVLLWIVQKTSNNKMILDSWDSSKDCIIDGVDVEKLKVLLKTAKKLNDFPKETLNFINYYAWILNGKDIVLEKKSRIVQSSSFANNSMLLKVLLVGDRNTYKELILYNKIYLSEEEKEYIEKAFPESFQFPNQLDFDEKSWYFYLNGRVVKGLSKQPYSFLLCLYKRRGESVSNANIMKFIYDWEPQQEKKVNETLTNLKRRLKEKSEELASMVDKTENWYILP